MKHILFFICVLIFSSFNCITYNQNIRTYDNSVDSVYSSVVVLRKKFISEITHRVMSTSASGVVIKQSYKYNYVLTVAHFCETEKTNVDVKDAFGNEYNGQAFIVDADNDMCVVRIEQKNQLRTIKIAPLSPRMGDAIYILGAPHSSFPVKTAGYVINNIIMKVDTAYCKDCKSVLVSAPSTHGSSGAPCYNSSNELVGIVLAVDTGFEHVTVISNLRIIKNILAKLN